MTLIKKQANKSHKDLQTREYESIKGNEKKLFSSREQIP